MDHIARFTREPRPASSTIAVPAPGANLSAEVEAYLAGQAENPGTHPGPGPGLGSEQRVLVSPQALEQLLADDREFRDMAEQIGCVPAGTVMLVLEEAITLLRREGWARGSYRSERGYCVTGVLRAAAKELGVAWEVGRAAQLATELALAAHTPQHSTHLIAWNDDLRRNAEQVLGLLTSAQAVAWHCGLPKD
jgi:hypothetical protein